MLLTGHKVPSRYSQMRVRGMGGLPTCYLLVAPLKHQTSNSPSQPCRSHPDPLTAFNTGYLVGFGRQARNWVPHQLTLTVPTKIGRYLSQYRYLSNQIGNLSISTPPCSRGSSLGKRLSMDDMILSILDFWHRIEVQPGGGRLGK